MRPRMRYLNRVNERVIISYQQLEAYQQIKLLWEELLKSTDQEIRRLQGE